MKYIKNIIILHRAQHIIEIAQVCLAFKLNVGFHFGTIRREISRSGNETQPFHPHLSELEVSITMR